MERDTGRNRQRDKERKRERGKGEGETERRAARLQIFSTAFFLTLSLSRFGPRSAHHGVRRGEARVHVEGRAGPCVPWKDGMKRHFSQDFV